MTAAYTDRDRMRYLELTDHVANAWLETFDYDLDFYTPEAWDLFTGFYRTGCRPATKTEAQLYMKHAGTKKRIAFLKTAVEKRYLRTQTHPTDKRSQLLTVSPDVKRKLDHVFDVALDEINAKFATNE